MKLRFGMVGGGIGSYIGDIHRRGAMIDDLAELVCGCFSRDIENSRATAKKWYQPDPTRVYADYREMAKAEAAREDGIDFVTIVTPNNSHYEIAKCFLEHGIHVMCDKPLAISVEQAEELAALAKERGLAFGVSYAYTGYPAIRQGRKMIEDGCIGDILHVRVCHPEDYVITGAGESAPDPMPWRYVPETVGESLCCGDLGTHAEQLLVQFTGLHIKETLAMFDRYPKYIPLETNVTALLKLDNGATGELWASQIATGYDCNPAVYVLGTNGSLEWKHEQPDLLKHTYKNGVAEYLSAGRKYMMKECNDFARVDAGHHEGFIEVFGNVYRGFCGDVSARKSGRVYDGPSYPTVEDGLSGQRFIAACVRSEKNGNTWESLE